MLWFTSSSLPTSGTSSTSRMVHGVIFQRRCLGRSLVPDDDSSTFDSNSDSNSNSTTDSDSGSSLTSCSPDSLLSEPNYSPEFFCSGVYCLDSVH